MQTYSRIAKKDRHSACAPEGKANEPGKEGSLKSEPPVLFQASLAVGAPDDPFEQEAEHVSRQVMHNYDQVNSVQRKFDVLGLQSFSIQPSLINTRISRRLQKSIYRVIQSKCEQCEKEEKDTKLQAKGDRVQFSGDESSVSAQMESRIQSQRGSGSGMDAVTQTAMESSFGADFSSVKIHTDSTAVQMSRDLNAHAFTIGNDVFFNEGRYQPQTKEGAVVKVRDAPALKTCRGSRQPGIQRLNVPTKPCGSNNMNARSTRPNATSCRLGRSRTASRRTTSNTAPKTDPAT